MTKAIRAQIAFTTVLSAFLISSGLSAIARPAGESAAESTQAEQMADVELEGLDTEALETEGAEAEIAPELMPPLEAPVAEDSEEASDLSESPEGASEEEGRPEFSEDLEEVEEQLEAEEQTEAAIPEDFSLQLKQSSKLSLKDALAIIESVELEAANQARSAAFMGNLEQPVIAIEVGMQAIAIDANAGEVLGVQDIRTVRDRDILAAAETGTTLKQLAKITLKDALQATEGFAGEEPQQVALVVDEGNLVYQATLTDQQVFIDAGNAEVLYSSGDSFEDSEKPRGSIQISTQQGAEPEEAAADTTAPASTDADVDVETVTPDSLDASLDAEPAQGTVENTIERDVESSVDPMDMKDTESDAGTATDLR